MTANSPTSSHAPRLNPFVFPSDTTFRFVLLIVSVVGASLFAYSTLYLSFFGTEEFDRVYAQCQDEVAAAYPVDDPDPAANTNQRLARKLAVENCVAPLEQGQLTWTIGGVALLLTLAGAIYWTAPALKIRRERLEPLGDEDVPGLPAYLVDLCREAGLSRTPTFVWNPLNPTSSGLAFGRLGRYYVFLTGGLVMKSYADRPAFRAVVLHELAHLRNADVNKTYFAVAVWRAFVIAALVPLAVGILYEGLIRSGDLAFVLDTAWRILALAALVYLTRSAVLRARESIRRRAGFGVGRPFGRSGASAGCLPAPERGRLAGHVAGSPRPGRAPPGAGRNLRVVPYGILGRPRDGGRDHDSLL